MLPATSHSLHRRLRLPSSSYAMDINLGYSGYVYGLFVAASLMQTVRVNVHLLVGDTISRIASSLDQLVALLFGDAGAATALAPDADTPAMFFEVGTDGRGPDDLIVRTGGFRNPATPESAIQALRDGQNVRSDRDLFMNGPEVFAFTLQRVPPLIKAVLNAAGRRMDAIDGFLFHQANRFMLEHLAKRLKIPADKFMIALADYGNTSSASIPLTITTRGIARGLKSPACDCCWRASEWASHGPAVLNFGPAICPELVEYGDQERMETPS